MPNTPEGRTYMKKKWVLDPDIVSGKRASRHYHDYYDGDEYVIEETPFVVPNGKWVMEKALICGGWSWLVGIDHSELEQVTLHSLYGTYEVLYISDKPFGYIMADEEDVDRAVYPAGVKSTGRKTLEYARQIHKGELGQGPRTPRLDYVRQPLEPGQKPNVTKARERRRGQYGWVALADLGEMTVGYNPHNQVDLVLGYWQFSRHDRWENGQRIGTMVDVAWGSSLDIKYGDAKFDSLTWKEFREQGCKDSSELWIRRGFAYTILRLQALGVEPGVLQPA